MRDLLKRIIACIILLTIIIVLVIINVKKDISERESEIVIVINTPILTEVPITNTPLPTIMVSVKPKEKEYVLPKKRPILNYIEEEPTASPFYTVYPGQFTDYEIRLVAALIHREGPGSTQIGYRSIASVVLNRVMNESHWFPDNVAGVIFQKGQFAGHTRSKLEATHPNKASWEAAKYVFKYHGSTLPKKVMFYRAWSSNKSKKWYEYLKYYDTIEGNNYYEAYKYY